GQVKLYDFEIALECAKVCVEVDCFALTFPGYTPPFTDRTWPVIHAACSEAKNSTAWAMSAGVPIRRSAMRSISRCWPSAPYDSHWRSDDGFERTNPGAMLLTVIPNGPSSWASWRVSPICAALADA